MCSVHFLFMTFLVIAVQHTTVQQVSSQLAFENEQMSPPFGYKNSTAYGHKSYKSAEEVPVIGTKNGYSL